MKPSLRIAITFAVAISLISPVVSAGFFDVEGSFERTLTVTGPVDLDLVTGSGSIEVHTGPSGTVVVKGRIRAGKGWLSGLSDAKEKVRQLEENPPIEQSGNSLRIGHIEDKSLSRNISISYEIVVPAETQLNSRTGSGSQSIFGIQGPLNVKAGSGSLTIEDIGDRVEATTGSGSIEVESVKGGLHAHAGSGSISVDEVSGAQDIHTGSGRVVLSRVDGNIEVKTGSGSVKAREVIGSLRVKTGSGSIRAQGDIDGEWRLNTSSGSATVGLPEDASFDIYCRTSSGGIHTDYPVTVQGKLSKKKLEGTVGAGGNKLEVTTSSGTIRIESSK